MAEEENLLDTEDALLLREGTEIATYLSEDDPKTESRYSSVKLNMRHCVMKEALLNICLTTFMMFIFATGSFIISVDTFMLVYPLEYLVVVLKRLSSITVHMYKHQNPDDTDALMQAQGGLFSAIMQNATEIFHSGKREDLFMKSLDTADSKQGVLSGFTEKTDRRNSASFARRRNLPGPSKQQLDVENARINCDGIEE